MSYARIKSASWVLLFTGAGTTLAFTLAILDEGLPRYWSSFEIVVPIVSTILAIVSGAALRIFYRAEPANFTGFWHLSLADLLAASFFTALVMSAFRAIWPASFSRVGIFASLVLGFGFVFCLLLAARRGCTRIGLKIVCALGTFVTALGVMASGFFVFDVLFESIFLQGDIHNSLDAVRTLLYLDESPGNHEWIFNVIRIGFLFLPLGYVLRKIAAATLERAP